MLAHQRQEQILDEVRRRGTVRVAEMAALYAVSEMTVRRDITQLAGRGLLERVHGGAALPPEPPAAESDFHGRGVQHLREKERIAERAARLVSAGTAVGIGAGSTAWAFARALDSVGPLTVVTNSLPAADVLHAAGRADRDIILTGGSRTLADALVGPIAIAAVRSLHLDLVVLGAHGLDLNAGLSSPNLLEADMNSALLASARRVVVLCDHTKFGTTGISSFASLGDVDVLVTDVGISESARESLEAKVGELIVA